VPTNYIGSKREGSKARLSRNASASGDDFGMFSRKRAKAARSIEKARKGEVQVIPLGKTGEWGNISVLKRGGKKGIFKERKKGKSPEPICEKREFQLGG